MFLHTSNGVIPLKQDEYDKILKQLGAWSDKC